jgi:hypothetical protein
LVRIQQGGDMDRLFSATYSDARANFLQACLQAKVSVSHHMHALKGPSGEVLATSVFVKKLAITELI